MVGSNMSTLVFSHFFFFFGDFQDREISEEMAFKKSNSINQSQNLGTKMVNCKLL